MAQHFTRKKIGEILVEMGILNASEVPQILDRLKVSGSRFGKTCLVDGLISDKALAMALAVQFGLDYVDLDSFKLNDNLLALLPPDAIFKYRFIPLEVNDRTLTIAVSDPTDVVTLDAVSYTHLTLPTILRV